MTLVYDGTPFADHGILVATTQNNAGTHSWRNTIDLAWAAGAQPAYGDPVITAFTSFLQGIQRDDSTIVQVALLPYVKGRQPLSSQGSLWEATVSLPCNNHDAGHAYPFNGSSGSPTVGELCILLKKGKFSGGGGRAGHMFIRNSIPLSDTTAAAGGPPVFTTSALASYPPAINSWASSKLGGFCEDNPLPRFVLIHAQKLTQTPAAHDIFDSAMAIPTYERLTMHDITAPNKK